MELHALRISYYHFPIQTIVTGRPNLSQQLSHLKQSPKPKLTHLHQISLYVYTSQLAIQLIGHGDRSSKSILAVPLIQWTIPYLLNAYHLYFETLERSYIGPRCALPPVLSRLRI